MYKKYINTIQQNLIVETFKQYLKAIYTKDYKTVFALLHQDNVVQFRALVIDFAKKWMYLAKQKIF